MDTPPLRLDDFLPFRLSVASNAVSARIARAYQSLFGLSIPEWRVIAVIAETGGLSQQEICGRTQMDKVTVSRAAIRLTDRTLVERVPHPQDRRAHALSLTESGVRLYREVVPQALAMERESFAGLSPTERQQLQSLLVRVYTDNAMLADGG